MAFNQTRWTRQTLAFNSGRFVLDDASIVDGPAVFSYMSAVDNIAAIGGANYFSDVVYDLAVGDIIIANGTDASNMFVVAAVDRSVIPGTITVVSFTPAGVVGTANIEDNAVTGPKLADPLNGVATGFNFSTTTASATPGTIRSLKGLMIGTNATMTSGNLVGVRGEVDCVSASGGFLYGVQGKLIPTGTLSGSVWAAGVFAQVDISAATMNAGQIACVWGDYGTTSGTLTDSTGMRGFAMTNTTAAVLNSQMYLYGGATYLLELATNTGGVGATYVATPTGDVASGDLRTLKITLDGATYYILAAAAYGT